MSGLVISGVGIGGIAMPPLANFLISNYTWRISYIIIGLISLVGIIIATQFLRHRAEQPDKSSIAAERVKAENSVAAVRGFSLREAMRIRQFWMIALIYFFFGFCAHIVVVHIVPHVTDIGIPPATAATILSAVGGTAILGKIGLGSLTDRIGIKSGVVVIMGLLVLAFVWLQFAAELWMFYVFAVVYALGFGGFSALMAPIAVKFFGLKAHGAILGAFFFSMSAGGAPGPIMAGRIFDVTGSYWSVFLICAMLITACLIIGSLLKPARIPD